MIHLRSLALYSSLFLIYMFSSCSGGNDSEASQEKSAVDTVVFSNINDADARHLIENCDYIDIIFHNNPMSVSMDTETDVKRFFSFFAGDPFHVPADCHADATIIFLGNGEELGEARLHYNDHCKGIIFFKDKGPSSGNPINKFGDMYFQNVVDQGNQILQQNQ